MDAEADNDPNPEGAALARELVDDITLHAATLADCALLSLIGSATFAATYPHMIAAEDMLSHCQNRHSEAAYQQLLQAGAHAWLAFDRAPVGYALVTAPDLLTAPDLPIETQPGDLELMRIYALPTYQGRGVGARLMQAAIVHAASCGAPRLLLGVYEGNARALAFYRKCGFQIIAERRFQVGEAVYRDEVLALSLS